MGTSHGKNDENHAQIQLHIMWHPKKGRAPRCSPHLGSKPNAATPPTAPRGSES